MIPEKFSLADSHVSYSYGRSRDFVLSDYYVPRSYLSRRRMAQDRGTLPGLHTDRDEDNIGTESQNLMISVCR